MIESQRKTQEPTPGPSGSGTEMGYVVEARSCLRHPMRLTCGMTLDGEWRRVEFEPSPIGVAVQAFGPGFNTHGRLLDFEAANALAWWFVANAREERDRLTPSHYARAIGVEIRLVQCKYTYSYSVEVVGVGKPFEQHRVAKDAFTPISAEESADV